MSHPEQPAVSDTDQVLHPFSPYRAINVDIHEFVRTRDALASAFLSLTGSLDRAVKAYLDHTQVVLNGDAPLSIGGLLRPFSALADHTQRVAQQALHQTPNSIVADPTCASGPAPPSGVTGTPEEKKRPKRAYKQRDPNAPKRPLTAYFRYLGANRPLIQREIAENPGAFGQASRPGDISRIATDRWNSLTRAEQEPYRQDYQEALREYEKAVKSYKKTSPNGDAKGKRPAAPAVTTTAVAGAHDSDDSDDDSSSSDSSDTSDDDGNGASAAPPLPPLQHSNPATANMTKAARDTAAATYGHPISTMEPPKHFPERKRKATVEPDARLASKKKSRRADAPVSLSSPAPAASTAAKPAAGAPNTTPAKDLEKEARKARRKEEKRRKSEAMQTR